MNKGIRLQNVLRRLLVVILGLLVWVLGVVVAICVLMLIGKYAFMPIYTAVSQRVTPPNYQEEWSGRWAVGINKLTTWHFRRDGTWTVSPTNPFIISEEGTYSVTDTSFVLTAGVGSSNVVRGTWNTIADKLVLYIESTSSFPFNREALVFDKYIESIEERKQRIGQEGGVMSPPPKLGSQ